MRVTLKQLSALAGVSSACVSNILNGKTAEYSQATIDRVRKIAREQNYRFNSIARSMVSKTTMTIGLILPDIANAFYPELAKGVESRAQGFGYSTILMNSNEDAEVERRAFATLDEKMVDGVVFVPSVNSLENEDSLTQYVFPIVVADRNYFSNTLLPTVISDNYLGSCLAVDHLAQRGRRRILLLSGDRYLGFTRGEIADRFYYGKGPHKPLPGDTLERTRGFFDALKRHGLPFSGEYFHMGKYTAEFGHQAVSSCLEQGLEFDAVYAEGDMIAVGAMQALREHGRRIPRDVAVVGYDNVELTRYLDPPLTTVHQPKYQMGEQAVEMLKQIIDDPQAPRDQKLILPPELIVRKTT